MTAILAIQGSLRPRRSNTDIILQEFLKGAQSRGAEAETVYLKRIKMYPCACCYTCWAMTPGKCKYEDNMSGLLERVRCCDVIVYATPLYNFNMSSLIKTFQERLLPLMDPHFIKIGDTYGHPWRDKTDRKMVLVSTCGLPEISHFDGLRQVFRLIERMSQVPLVGELLMPSGELLKEKNFREKLKDILDAAYQAGVELVDDGRVSKGTELRIQSPPIRDEDMAGKINAQWDNHLEWLKGKGNNHEK